ncbi:MAG: MOSC domain-containing protein, partial [Rhizobiales bacterium]|nr:MOSC domain-containing protein [Hyphomicrobiales bacterium]
TTSRIEEVAASFEGFAGERHSGLVTASDVRYRKQYDKGTAIRNTRQVSMLSVEDLQQIAENLQVERVEPDWLGANLVVSGIPRFTEVPPSSRLLFTSGASLVVDNENQPCRYPADVVDRHFPGAGARFVAAARNLRGTVGWVEREGHIRVGDKIALHIPPQRIYDAGL